MNDLEFKIKNMIIERYGSLKKFTEEIDMPWTTLDSILKRGFANSNITNVLKITKELKIDAEALVDGKLIDISELTEPLQTIAAHFEGNEYTKDELEEIGRFAEFVKNRRK